jgi:hypothetical protein
MGRCFPALSARRRMMADAGEGLNRAGVDAVLWVPLRDRAQPVRWSLLAVGVLAWAGGATVFFRYPLFSSFAVIFGERGDARMIVFSTSTSSMLCTERRNSYRLGSFTRYAIRWEWPRPFCSTSYPMRFCGILDAIRFWPFSSSSSSCHWCVLWRASLSLPATCRCAPGSLCALPDL